MSTQSPENRTDPSLTRSLGHYVFEATEDKTSVLQGFQNNVTLFTTALHRLIVDPYDPAYTEGSGYYALVDPYDFSDADQRITSDERALRVLEDIRLGRSQDEARRFRVHVRRNGHLFPLDSLI